ncbi:hypothetical protein DPMN_059538 [Dreissena polymorpha]|uniref:B box-type domain-containing protein n=1 Tax=Dreissena polymorpha TaxID=45954 RepID=A0A9D4HGP9_DREPO|nr:hypothetical protein DPMN_059538 [Dreissena polymorpha]
MAQEVFINQTETCETKTFSNGLKPITFDDDLKKEGEIISKREEQITEYCTPCGARNVKKEALNVCQKCDNEFLCAECSKYHKFGGLSSTHILVSADKFVETLQKGAKLCDICNARNIKKDAQNVCQECGNEYLCAECSANHKFARLSSTHILVSAETFLETLKKCNKLCDPCNARYVKRDAHNVCQECGNEYLSAELTFL